MRDSFSNRWRFYESIKSKEPVGEVSLFLKVLDTVYPKMDKASIRRRVIPGESCIVRHVDGDVIQVTTIVPINPCKKCITDGVTRINIENILTVE